MSRSHISDSAAGLRAGKVELRGSLPWAIANSNENQAAVRATDAPVGILASPQHLGKAGGMSVSSEGPGDPSHSNEQRRK